MDPAVGELLGAIDAAVHVIDCLPNMTPELVAERTEPLVRQLRAAHPSVPIVLVEDRCFTNSWIRPERRRFHDANHAALRAVHGRLLDAGLRNLYYVEGDGLLGDDGEGATDGSHPSDLGFMRQADAFAPALSEALR